MLRPLIGTSYESQCAAMIMNFIFGATALLFAGMAGATWRRLRHVQRLPSLNSLEPGRTPTEARPFRCSIVIAARDEQARIEQTISRLIRQQGIELELIVVDDRSKDRTHDIVASMARDDSRIRIMRIDVLPDGWLGKCHACHIGANAATGEWILFTDADCWIEQDVILRSLIVAEQAHADHITIAPRPTGTNFGASAWYLLFLTSLTNWFSGVNTDKPKAHVGFGAFNLVRADAYRKCGGYEALRLTVVDDVKLGLLLQRAGKRTRGFLGGEDLECHWGATVGDMVKVMEKNYFAALDFKLGLVLAGSLFVMGILTLLCMGLLSATPAGLCAAFSLLLLAFPARVLARRVGLPSICAVLVPFMFPVFFYTLLNSTYCTLRNGGVRWRETFYPLAQLRTWNVR